MLPPISDSVHNFDTYLDSARASCDGMTISQLQLAFRSASQLVSDLTENICYKAKLISETKTNADDKKLNQTFVGDHRWRKDLLEHSEMRACLVCQRKRHRAVYTRHGCAQCVVADQEKNGTSDSLHVPLCTELCHAVHHEEAALQLNSVAGKNNSSPREHITNGAKESPNCDLAVVAGLLSQLTSTHNSFGNSPSDLSTLLQGQLLASLCQGIGTTGSVITPSVNGNSLSPSLQNGNSHLNGGKTPLKMDDFSFNSFANSMMPVRTRGRPRIHHWITSRGGYNGERKPRARGSRGGSAWGEHHASVASRGTSRRGRPPLHGGNSPMSLVNNVSRKRTHSGASSGSDLPAIKPLLKDEETAEDEVQGLDLSTNGGLLPSEELVVVQPELENEEILPTMFPSVEEKQRLDNLVD